MKNTLKYLAAPLLLLLSASSSFGCRKEPNYPVEPAIEYNRVEQYTFVRNRVQSDSLVLVINFRDGDGNLGLSTTHPADTLAPFNPGSPYYNNFILNLLIQETLPDGSTRFVQYPLPGANTLSGRFPRISSDERIEPLEGEIKYSLALPADAFNPGDVVKFEIFIYDRSTPIPNKSNVVETDPIILFSR